MNQVTDYEQQAIDFLTQTGTYLTFNYEGFKKYFSDDTQKRNVFSWTFKRGDKVITGMFGSSINDSCKPTPKLNSNEPVEIYTGISTRPPIKNPNNKKIYFSFTINTTCNILNQINAKTIDAESIINTDALQDRYDKFVSNYAKGIKNNEPKGIMSSFDSCKNYVTKRILATIEQLKTETVLLDQSDTALQPSAYDLLACLTKYDPGTFENFCSDYGYDPDSRKAEKIYHSVVKEWNDISSLFNEKELSLLSEIN